MIRLIHLLAITILIGSAAYAYSTKYETLYYSETLAKLKGKIQKERESVAIAKAEWAMLTRPDRLQRMVDRHLDLQPMGIAQLTRFSDIPNKPSKGDAIAAKLDSLGHEPSTTGSTSPSKPVGPSSSKPKPKPVGKPGTIGAKLDSLGLGAAKPAPKPQSTAQVRPQANAPASTAPRPVAKPAVKPAPAPSNSQPKPAAR